MAGFIRFYYREILVYNLKSYISNSQTRLILNNKEYFIIFQI